MPNTSAIETSNLRYNPQKRSQEGRNGMTRLGSTKYFIEIC